MVARDEVRIREGSGNLNDKVEVTLRDDGDETYVTQE